MLPTVDRDDHFIAQSEVANVVSELLKNHSVAYILHAYISKVPIDDLIELIQSSPDATETVSANSSPLLHYLANNLKIYFEFILSF